MIKIKDARLGKISTKSKRATTPVPVSEMTDEQIQEDLQWLNNILPESPNHSR
jgi:hypothetical protein